PIYAKISYDNPFMFDDGRCTAIFIDRKVLESSDFVSIVQEVMAQMLHYKGTDESSDYSYELTELMATELNAFINNPTLIQKIHTLQDMYDNVEN
ncbi:MAG: hypothetical protein MJ231_05420, partial [bacterium]|nr:hypothetical protein [bacterium]